MATHLFSAGLLAMVVACSSDAGPRVGPDGGATVVPGVVSLVVEGASEETSIGARNAGPGKSLVLVHLGIGNGLGEAISINPLSFRLRASDLLESIATPIVAGLPNQCPVDALLTAATGISCAVVFELETTAEPSDLIWAGGTDPAQPAVEAPVTNYQRCARCGGLRCVPLKYDSFNCGACGTAVALGNVCVNGTERVLADRADCGADHAMCYRKENPNTVGYCLEDTCVDLRTGEGGGDNSSSTCDELCAEYSLSCSGEFGVRSYYCPETDSRMLQYASCTTAAIAVPGCEHVYTGCDCL